ncbi:MAG: D-Ala-D-Ala carboxypeptidase family metallohydrolase [Rudaea sp.]|nr:D-Ala-D-Ala carboxypeptidase family metallohydrolase [Rudaea sp.]
MQLSPHFSLESMIASQTAARLGLCNTPTNFVLGNLTDTCNRMEGVRAMLGNRPILVSSGYRAPAVNAAIGGATTSAHVTGHAIDFTCPDFGTPLEVATFLSQQAFEFDQLIYEYGAWVHLSFDPRARRQCLTILSAQAGYKPGIAVG